MPAPESLNPASLSIEQMAKLLSQAGGQKVLAATIAADVAAGAPRNKDGTLHLVHYTAWLVEQIS